MNLTIIQITVIPTLMRWRAEVIEHVFGTVPSKRLLVCNRRYYERHIPDGSHIAVVAQADGNDAGCGAICLTDELPSPDNPTGRCAYLMNIYVRREYRNQGIAHAIVGRLVEMAKEMECGKIYLETTPEARSLYGDLGFRDLPDIMKYADIQHP